MSLRVRSVHDVSLFDISNRPAFDTELSRIMRDLNERLNALVDRYEVDAKYQKASKRSAKVSSGIDSCSVNDTSYLAVKEMPPKRGSRNNSSSSGAPPIVPPNVNEVDECELSTPVMPPASLPVSLAQFGDVPTVQTNNLFIDESTSLGVIETPKDVVSGPRTGSCSSAYFNDIDFDLRTAWREFATDAHQDAIDSFGKAMELKTVESNRLSHYRIGPDTIVSSRSITRWTHAESWFRPESWDTIMHPMGPTRLFWSALTLFLITTDLILIPMAAFDVGESKDFQVFHWICTCFWTVDILMSFRTGYFEKAKVEMRPLKIARKYARTWLSVDLMIVGFEWMARFFNELGDPRIVRLTRSLRIIRLTKLLRLAKMRDLLHELEGHINSNVLVLLWEMSYLTTILIFGVHIMTCFWYALGKSAHDGWQSYDIYVTNNTDEQSRTFDTFFWYIAACRWVISQLNGRTDLDERRNMRERGFTVLAGVFFAIVGQAMFISLITKKMLELADLFKDKRLRRRMVNDYLSNFRLSPVLSRSVKEHIRDYHDMSLQRNNEKRVLSLLPAYMQSELLFQIRAPVLFKRPLFEIIAQNFMSTVYSICRNVMQSVYADKLEIVFEKDDTCNRMLLVQNGNLMYGVPEQIDENEAKKVVLEMKSTVSAMKSTISGMKSTFSESARRGFSSVMSMSAVQKRKSQTTISLDMWLSEAALWMNWTNQGSLVAAGSSHLFEIDAFRLSDNVTAKRGELAIMVVYARKFREELMAEGPSDLVKFDISIHLDYKSLPQ